MSWSVILELRYSLIDITLCARCVAPLQDEDTKENVIPVSDKDQVKAHIVDLMCTTTPSVQSQVRSNFDVSNDMTRFELDCATEDLSFSVAQILLID